MKRDLVVEEYAVGGGIAALFYVDPFETHDLEVFLVLRPTEGPLASLESVFTYLSGRGYTALGRCAPQTRFCHAQLVGGDTVLLEPGLAFARTAVELPVVPGHTM